MRSESEIKDRLRELHGTSTPNEMGGKTALAEAGTLAWILGHDDPDVDYTPEGSRYTSRVDVSEYVDGVEEIGE